ncbi:DUF2612 domain-containing protein (plasmid) [Vibrio harveyi]|uniref:DUF2612 domain-containing protein n=1 Tax=Vibrio harveyi TaxID=669 RepID=UPI00234C6EDC|nr:DUF2612 domain-containing protein [Vibrio harveyi]WCP84231.1 DUF2612 domain-containing protein [Vibrio harveyi]
MIADNVIEYWASGRWREKRKFREWVKTTGTPLEEISAFYNKLTYDIDKAEGYLLDVIGAILDVPRLQIPVNLLFFGYQGTPLAVGYDKAPYFDFNNDHDTRPATDSMYRMALHFKVFFNVTDGTRASVIKATKTLTGVNDVELVDNEDMQFKIILHEHVDDVTLYVLNKYALYIKPSGVKFLGYETPAKSS